MLLLTLRDLQYRAVRFLVVIVATGVVFALLLLMTGLADELSLESLDAVDQIGAAGWVVPNGVSGPFTSSVTMDPAAANEITGALRADPAVVSRASMISRSGEHREVVVLGYTAGGVGSPRVTKGAVPATREQIALDESAGFAVGDSVRFGATTFRVAGLTQRTTVLAGIPMVFLRIGAAQDIVFRGQSVATAVLLRGRATSVPDGLTLLTNRQVAQDTRKPLEQAIKSVNLIRVLLWIVSAMIIGGVIYLSSMERRRDFAVLKAIGAPARPLLAGLAVQGAIVALAAVLLATALQGVLAPTFPLPIRVSARSMLQLPALALVVAMLASAAGMRQVAKTDPALSFA